MNCGTTCHPIALFADAGVPMIALTLPGMIAALIPIVVVEALVIQRRVAYKTWPVFRATAVANLASTLIGIPLTWIVLVLCEMAIGAAALLIPAVRHGNWNSPIARVVSTILSAPWLAPAENTGPWVVPLAVLVLLVPFFFASVWSERFVMERMMPVAVDASPEAEISKPKLRKAVLEANLVSYAALFGLTSVWLVWATLHR
jgi:hypothetical protein